MTLEEATRQAHSAAMAGDLDAVEKALAARADAIAAGGVPTSEIISTGEQTLELLRSLVRRLGQIQTGFAASLNLPPNIDCRG
jgi:hypothetical protein